MNNGSATEQKVNIDEGLYKRIISFTKKQSKFDEMKVDVLKRYSGADDTHECSCAGLRKVVQADVAAALGGGLDASKSDRPQLLRKLVLLGKDGPTRAELWRVVAARYRPVTSHDESVEKEKLSKFIMNDDVLKESIVKTTTAAIEDYTKSLFEDFGKRKSEFEKSEREYREKERMAKLHEEERQRKEREERERKLAKKRELEEQRLRELKEERERKEQEARAREEKERARLKKAEEERETQKRKEKERRKSKENQGRESSEEEESNTSSSSSSESSSSESSSESERKERKRKRKERKKEQKKRHKKEEKQNAKAKRKGNDNPPSNDQVQSPHSTGKIETPKVLPAEASKALPKMKTPKAQKQKHTIQTRDVLAPRRLFPVRPEEFMVPFSYKFEGLDDDGKEEQKASAKDTASAVPAFTATQPSAQPVGHL